MSGGHPCHLSMGVRECLHGVMHCFVDVSKALASEVPHFVRCSSAVHECLAVLFEPFDCTQFGWVLLWVMRFCKFAPCDVFLVGGSEFG